MEEQKKTANEIQAALAMPFAAEDLEWRIQVAFESSMQGVAVPYVTNRAIQNRLDEVVGPQNWYNEYKPWHGTGKREAQICGISIFFEGRGFITKWDGAEDSDIEPVKGGLSDSMKRAAVQWGIGRVLYNMDTVYVNIEKRGKSYVIKPSERPKLNRAYTDMLAKLKLKAAAPCGVQSLLTPQRAPGSPEEKPTPAPQPTKPQEKKAEPEEKGGKIVDITQLRKAPESPAWEYTVADAKVQKGMSGENTSLMLLDRNGKKFLAYTRGTHPELCRDARLFNVRKTLKQKDSVVFYYLESFEILEQAA
ncbi:MAG: hypothetical protein II885_00670 [Oscillospiraceae bacterium]|nr:hypothetical protein [Oscillospiraceae bacterium]